MSFWYVFKMRGRLDPSTLLFFSHGSNIEPKTRICHQYFFNQYNWIWNLQFAHCWWFWLNPSHSPQIFFRCYLSMRFILTKLNSFRNHLLWGLIAGNTSIPMIQHEKGRDSIWYETKNWAWGYSNISFMWLLRRTVILIRKDKMFRFHTNYFESIILRKLILRELIMNNNKSSYSKAELSHDSAVKQITA